jgi:chromosome segregation ATPase
MRIAELEEHEEHARAQHEAAVAEEDPQAEAIREWPERTRARIEELKASVAELGTAEELVSERIRAAEQDVEDLRLLQTQLVARVAAARNTGVSREVFDTLNDALNYVGLVLDSATDEDPNGPPRRTNPAGDS